jgi:capsid protein
MPDVYPTPRPLSSARARQFAIANGYDATEDRGRRRAPITRTMHEDHHAEERHRRILSASTRDLARNYAITAWAIRKHLDYIADFSFQATTPDADYNKYVGQWWKAQSSRHAFDVASRHPHRRAIRLAEAGKCVDGDHWWLKLAPPKGNPLRGKRQLIEGDRVDMPRGGLPKNSKPEDWLNGVRVDRETGRALAVGVCRRVGKSRKELQRIVSARNINQHAAYEFRVDQVRGLSAINSALNWFRDTYEGFEYALAKMKISQLFGLQITQQSGDGSTFAGPRVNEEDADGDGTADSAPRIDLKRGIFVYEGEPGEEVKVVEGKTPAAETVDFLKLMIHIALKALDIPFSFFDESFTNFYGSRGGLIQYLHSCHNKVLDLQDFLDDDFRWRAGLAVEDGELELPSGKEFSYLTHEFVPGGVPWWDPAKEARGQAMSIAMGQTSPQRVCRETGTDFYQNILDIEEALKFAGDHNVALHFADSTAFRPEIAVTSDAEVASVD